MTGEATGGSTASLPDPVGAPPRPDLTFLRHRRPAKANPVVAEFIAGRATHPRRPSRPAAAVPTPAGRPAPPTTRPSTSRPPATTRPTAAPAAARTDDSLDLFGSPPTSPSPVPRTPAAPSPAAPADPLDLTAPGPAATPPPAASGDPLDLSGPAPAAARSANPPANPSSTGGSGGSPLDLFGDRPAPTTGSSTSLDLGGPPVPAPTRPPSSDTSLDLGGPPARPATSPPAATPPGGSTSLDLGGGTTPTPAASAPPRPAAAAGRSAHRPAVARVRPGVPTILNRAAPTVTLTRVQSGVGTLTIEAAVPDSADTVRLGCAYQLASGRSSTVQHSLDRRFAPLEASRRPVVLSSHQRYERLAVDLRQVTEVERLTVYATSQSGAPVEWTGTLLITTFGGGRIELPIEVRYGGHALTPGSGPASTVLVLATVLRVDGELVIRSEMDAVADSVRDSVRAFGFDRISWLDATTPVD